MVVAAVVVIVLLVCEVRTDTVTWRDTMLDHNALYADKQQSQQSTTAVRKTHAWCIVDLGDIVGLKHRCFGELSICMIAPMPYNRHAG